MGGAVLWGPERTRPGFSGQWGPLSTSSDLATAPVTVEEEDLGALTARVTRSDR